ncbi:DUF4437 domain-containing protein [Seonamhaeicola marinus]|uniref:DUF4437 domain-containing protein n=1 Tax=Seonamhaeicola marinus TaxID=1912246 RepID=A0A5D0HKP2_9FLAO|nr:DUF4437 domain-containing protein [Seonamhaeicola marinus]TYA71964.1 DUF4437 domain-containing protein [Seonamhaeicola marinus]
MYKIGVNSTKLIVFLGVIFLTSCKSETKEVIVENQIPESIENTTTKVVLASEVDWTYLNPKRKDKAPLAGTLWGDRKGTEPTGFLLKPKDKFSSPPHIHNVSYRGIVISGLIHNDDPDAGSMWMPAGSFWTQPKGEVHITSAVGENTIAYIEIEKGPYLVLPKEEAFDSGERPVNVDKSNIVWLNANDITWSDVKGTQVAFLWDEGELRGTLLRFPSGFKGKLYTKASTFGAVLVNGQINLEDKTLETGSYFSSKGEALHHITTENSATLYIRSNNKYEVIKK